MQYRKKKEIYGMQFRHQLSVPFIWGMIVPVVLLDFTAEIYKQVCFRLYGIQIIPRSNYIQIDRQHLQYLSGAEKLFCMYCGYVNGVFAYVSAIGGMTELYWCAIRHQQKKDFVEPVHHRDFVAYGDESALVSKFGK